MDAALARLSDGSTAHPIAAASRRLTWRAVAAALAIAFGLDLWLAFDAASEDLPQIPALDIYVSGTIVNVVMAFAVMFATFVADEAVARGARRFTAYAWAIVGGCAVGTCVQWLVHRAVGLPTRYEVQGVAADVAALLPVALFFEYLIWASIIVSVYVSRRGALIASARMSAAQVARVQAQRRALESRLQALQARIEPQFLFNTLAQVRDLFDRDAAGAARMLDDLILYLRAALPRLRDTTSTLEQEIALAQAYLGIVSAQRGRRVGCRVDVPPDVRGARVPALLVLPVMDRLLADASPTACGEMRFAARRGGGRLQIEIRRDGDATSWCDDDGDDVLRALRERVQALFGHDADLRLERTQPRARRVVIHFPYATADRDHR